MNEENVKLFPKYLMYGHAYVPNQVMRKIFTLEEALDKGTLYPELVSPYMPNQSIKVIETLKGGEIYGD